MRNNNKKKSLLKEYSAINLLLEKYQETPDFLMAVKYQLLGGHSICNIYQKWSSG